MVTTEFHNKSYAVGKLSFSGACIWYIFHSECKKKENQVYRIKIIFSSFGYNVVTMVPVVIETKTMRDHVIGNF